MTPFRSVFFTFALGMTLFSYSSWAQSQAQFGSPQFSGSGCSNVTASATLSPQADTLSILFDSFNIMTAPGRAVQRSECAMSIPVQIPAGQQLAVFQVDYRGYAVVPDNATARIDSFMSFGNKASSSFTRTFDRMNSDYTLTHRMPMKLIALSQCGGADALSMRTAITAQSLSGVGEVQIGVDSADLSFGIAYRMRLQACSSSSDGNRSKLKTVGLSRQISGQAFIDLKNLFTLDSSDQGQIQAIIVDASGSGQLQLMSDLPMSGGFIVDDSKNIAPGQSTELRLRRSGSLSGYGRVGLQVNGNISIDAVHLLIALKEDGGGYIPPGVPQPPSAPIQEKQVLKRSLNLASGQSLDLYSAFGLDQFRGYRITAITGLVRGVHPDMIVSMGIKINSSADDVVSQKMFGVSNLSLSRVYNSRGQDTSIGSGIRSLSLKAGSGTNLLEVQIEVTR